MLKTLVLIFLQVQSLYFESIGCSWEHLFWSNHPCMRHRDNLRPRWLIMQIWTNLWVSKNTLNRQHIFFFHDIDGKSCQDATTQKCASGLLCDQHICKMVHPGEFVSVSKKLTFLPFFNEIIYDNLNRKTWDMELIRAF